MSTDDRVTMLRAWVGGRCEVLAPAVLCVVLTHLPFWFVQARLFELRPVFSYDLLALLLVGALFRRPLVFLVLLCWLLDGIQSVATSFHFANAAEFIDSARFAGLIHLGDLMSASVVGLATLFAGSAALLVWCLPRLQVRAADLLPLVLVIAAVDIANGSTRIPGLGRDSVLVTTNIAGSPLWNMVTRLKAGRDLAVAPSVHWEPPPVSYAAVRDWMISNPEGSVLVVLVESMGLSGARELREALLAPLRAALPPGQWEIRSSQELFNGGTTHGELRVLCGVNGRYQSVREGKADTSSCLPRRWTLQGRTPVGLHGFSGRMFDRQQWWPRIGLTQTLFAEDLAHDGNRCGEAFQGVCDRALVQEAVRRLGPGPSFVYALTLNTHLPIRDRPVDSDFEQLCARNRVTHLPCLLLFRQSELMRDIGEAVRTAPTPPLVVIAGDHAPPFGDVRDRAAFSKDSVPVILVRPRL